MFEIEEQAANVDVQNDVLAQQEEQINAILNPVEDKANNKKWRKIIFENYVKIVAKNIIV